MWGIGLMEEEHLLRSDSISLTPKSTKCFETSYTACWNRSNAENGIRFDLRRFYAKNQSRIRKEGLGIWEISKAKKVSLSTDQGITAFAF
jgi:hypothetical protein